MQVCSCVYPINCNMITDQSMIDGRQQFEVNFFGLTQVTKKALEVLRDQKPSGGLIQMVTSIGGQRGVPLFTYYCASKWAVEGFTAALVCRPSQSTAHRETWTDNHRRDKSSRKNGRLSYNVQSQEDFALTGQDDP